jgi:hypothetical protein
MLDGRLSVIHFSITTYRYVPLHDLTPEAILVRVKPLLLALLMAAPSVAEWPRFVITPKGDRVDKPEAHDLKYFTEHPSLRDESGDFCYLCTEEQRLAEAKKDKAKAEVRKIGKLSRFTAFDVFHYFGEDPRPAWKSIIVQTGSDLYQEIYHDQPHEGQPNPSFIVKAGKELLLCVADNVYKWDAEEDCFWLGTKGVVRLDFSPVWKSAQRATPAGRRVWEHGLRAKTTFNNLTLPVGIRHEESSRCCDRGVVNVKFKLDHGRVVVVGAEFDSNTEYEW